MKFRPTSVVAAAAVAATLMAPAWAHPRLVAASPANNGIATATPAIALKFSERLIPRFSGIAISRAGGAPIGTPKTAMTTDGRTLLAHVSAPLVPGTYTLAWHAVSVDTHRVGGSYRFTVR